MLDDVEVFDNKVKKVCPIACGIEDGLL